MFHVNVLCKSPYALLPICVVKGAGFTSWWLGQNLHHKKTQLLLLWKSRLPMSWIVLVPGEIGDGWHDIQVTRRGGRRSQVSHGNRLELQTIHRFSQSRRRPLLGLVGLVSIVSYSHPSLVVINELAFQFHVCLLWGQCLFSMLS